jgi:amino acid adenylation domain-containing protein
MSNHSAIFEPQQPSRNLGPVIERFLESTFLQLFAEQVAADPNRPAVIAGEKWLTYGELNARANQLAHRLRSLGAGAESLVGICIDRSLDMAVGILGILKSGAGYLPIDPDYPSQRLQWMLEDSGVSLVITQNGLVSKLSSCAARLVTLERISEHDANDLDHEVAPGDLAYVIYTSGSTGDPKGVMITHASLANYVLALQHELQIQPSDRYLHTASIAFSSSRRQLLLPLSRGAAVVIANAEERKDPLALFEMIKREGVTVMDAVPSFWRSCTAMLESLEHQKRARLLDNQLRLMLSASEPLLSDIPRTWLRRFRHRARHFHMFGQTETAGIVCLHEIADTEDEVHVVPIGRPLANTEIYILDEQQQPVPAGTSGELYIGGAGVGRGYLRRPELTATKFVPHPFNESGGRLYRTGDWARWRTDGSVEFAGRQDSQVKLRGFRVELGEIEAALAHHASVEQGVVIMKDDGKAKRLVAYVVSHDHTPVTELREFLHERLPDYMVPSVFMKMEALPLNANGKVDRLALPEPPETRPELTTHYESPQTTTEQMLASIWAQVLGVEGPGIDDNFFELGGHSLLAMQVVARINQQLNVTLPIRELFERPTIRQLAVVVGARHAVPLRRRHVVPRRSAQYFPLSSAQQRLWFLDQLEPGGPLYNINRALRLSGPFDLAKLERAVQSVASRHEALRTTFGVNDGRPFQQIATETILPCEVYDLRAMPAATRDAEAQRLLKAEAEKPFDLAIGPLARVSVLRLADEEHILLLSIHHIIADAWSVKLFFQELAACYSNEEKRLPALPVQYADFSEWQRERIEAGTLAQEIDFWKDQLADAPLLLNLPTDHPRPTAPTSNGARQTVSLDHELAQSLKAASRNENVTLFMLLMAAFQILMSRYSDQQDLLIGTPVAGRPLVETEPLIGCFINTLVLRGDLSGNPTLSEVVRRTRERMLSAFTHQDVPFEKLVEELRPERSLSRSPIFQVMFVLQDETRPELALPEVKVSPVEAETATAKFELSLGITEKPEAMGGGMNAWLSYSTDLFELASIAAMLRDYENILRALVHNREQRISDLPALGWAPRMRGEVKQATVEVLTQREFVAPRTPVEERLADIWQEVLGLDAVSVHANFFELGGHSLLAAQVIARARHMFPADLTLRRLFETPTIAGLAESIYELQTEAAADEELAAMLAELSQLSDEEAQQRVASESLR